MHFIENHRWGNVLQTHILLFEVTDTRSGHRGQVTGGSQYESVV